MFQGTTALNMDAKGRIAIPARHRDALVVASAGRLVLTAHPQGCLLLYPEPAWAPIRDKILAAPSFDPRSAALKRVLVGNALDEEMDAAGRLLITPELREHADLEKQVRLVGMGSHFEIWSEAGWKGQDKKATEVFATLGEAPLPGFEGISL